MRSRTACRGASADRQTLVHIRGLGIPAGRKPLMTHCTPQTLISKVASLKQLSSTGSLVTQQMRVSVPDISGRAAFAYAMPEAHGSVQVVKHLSVVLMLAPFIMS